MNFNGKNVLITGASSGIGLELSNQLVKENCNIAFLARSKNKLDELAEKLSSENTSNKFLPFKCDVSNNDNVTSVFNEVKNSFGKIDIAILNSGVSFRMDVDNFNIKKAEEIISVNLMGLIYCVNNLLPEFKKNKKGIIAGVSSLADVRGFPKSGMYCASKAAATTFLESLRIELKKYNIKVITVKPGFVKTSMTDKNEFKMPFLMDAAKAASIIIKGIKKEKKIIQFPLPIVLSTKILKILPNSIFDFLLNRKLPGR